MQIGIAIKITTNATTITRKKPSKKLVLTVELFAIVFNFLQYRHNLVQYP